MLGRWPLFETRVDELLRVFLERRLGPAVVRAEWLALQRSGKATAISETQETDAGRRLYVGPRWAGSSAL
jgi:hypothetical protein